MLIEVMHYELRQRLPTRAFGIMLMAVAGLGLLAAWLLSRTLSVADAPGALSSGVVVTRTLLLTAALASLPVISLAADLVRRDRDAGFAEIVQAAAGSTAIVLMARYVVQLVLAGLLLAALIVGYEIGCRMPWAPSGLAGTVPWRAYWALFTIALFPNAAIISALAMCLAIASQNRLAPWLVLFALFAAYSVGQILVASEMRWRAAGLIDVNAVAPVRLDTRLLTRAEGHRWHLTLTGYTLWNRLLWLLIGAGALALAALLVDRRTRGQRLAVFQRLRMRPAGKPAAETAGDAMPLPDAGARPIRFRIQAAIASGWPPFLMRTRFELATLFRSPSAMLLITLPALLAFPMLYYGITNEDDQKILLPVTSSVVAKLATFLALVCQFIAIIVAGELTWRERQAGMSEIIDASGASVFSVLPAKIAAVAAILVAQLAAVSVAGIVYQKVAGAPQIDVAPYLARLFLGEGAPALILAAMAVLVHALLPLRMLAHVVATLLWLQLASLSDYGIDHPLLKFTSLPTIELSDMNGVGHFVWPALYLAAFWGCIGAALLFVADILRDRGRGTPLLQRLKAFNAASRESRIALGCALGAAGVVGAVILWGIQVRAGYASASREENTAYLYEQIYGPFVSEPQPRVSAIDLALDLYPAKRTYNLKGTIEIRNSTEVPITRFFIDQDPSDLKLDIPDAAEIRKPSPVCCTIHEVVLKRPLAPGEQLTIRFEDVAIGRLQWSGAVSPLRYNGTQLKIAEITPTIGVHPSNFLQDSAKREQRKLPRIKDAPGGKGSATRSFYSVDSDKIRFAVTISTSADQIAVAPGTLAKFTEADGRRQFRYEIDRPIDADIQIHSARFAEVVDRWRDISLIVHHHPTHGANVPPMIEGMKLGLEYCVEAFGPYPFRELRLVEYPYATDEAASAQPGMISFSETGGFIEDARREGAVQRQIIQTAAHEVAHMWWGNHVVPANRPGAQVLSESIADYVNRMVTRKRFGSGTARNDVRRAVDKYLRSRGNATPERPLVALEKNADRTLYYEKGSSALYALFEIAGERAVNRALARFAREFGGKTNPYPEAMDLVRVLKAELGAANHTLIEDLFERVTLWHFAISEAKTEKTEAGKWKTTLALEAAKLEADALGAETPRPMQGQRVVVSAYEDDANNSKFTYVNAIVRVNDGKQTVSFETAFEPKYVRINPSRALFQRDIGKASAEIAK